MRKVAVVGGPGSGKSVLASELARRLGVAHVELDAHWWAPHWTPVARADFRRAVAGALASDGWVVDGNYLDEAASDLVWPAADTLVWLDPPRRLAVARALRRSARRAARRTDLWGTNRQGWSVLAPASVMGLVRRWPGYSQRVQQLLASGRYPHLRVVRLRRRRDVRRWLAPPFDGRGSSHG